MRKLLAAFSVTLLLAGAVHSQVTTSKTSTTTMSAASSKASTDKPRTAASLQCSKDADAKNLHGKSRKPFMSSCKKAAGK